VHKFVDEVGPAISDKSRRQNVVDAALDPAEDLLTARPEVQQGLIVFVFTVTRKVRQGGRRICQ
jgi:hypothetical protein